MKKLFLLAKTGEINEKASVVDKQELLVNAPIERVWKTLADIAEWPQWYTGVTIIKAPKSFVEGQTFYWKQDGVRIRSKLAKIEKPRVLSWTGRVVGIKVVHVWKLETRGKWKTKVKVEESMEGFLVSLFMNSQKLHKVLKLWINLLKIRAEKRKRRVRNSSSYASFPPAPVIIP
ncbi:MAG: SRPBCC family protein [Candidatus Aminicenantes bacterium]|nr:SRPBCC family protein [Candidatus Aminicenantes bacterium]